MYVINLPADFTFDERGLVRTADNKVIANYYLRPVQAYCRPGNSLPDYCDIEVVQVGQCFPLPGHKELPKLTPAWWKSSPPGCYYSQEVRAPHKQLNILFQKLLGMLQPVEIFIPKSLGWAVLPTGEHVYVTGSGAIGPDVYSPESQVWIPAALKSYQLETLASASKEEITQYFWHLYRLIPGVTDILLANTLAAILFPCFKDAGIESRFPVILEGPSEAKKTTLACLTSCLYNRKSGLRSSIATLTSTGRALEKRGIDSRHSILVIDDLFPDGGSDLEKKALELIRNIANQVPRESRSGNTLEGSAMECGAVITAEAFPNCGRSTRTRCLRLVLSEPIPNSRLSPVQEHPELLGNVFQKFIVQIAGNFEKIVQQITDDFRGYRSRRAQTGASPVSSERLYEIGFVLYTALKIYFEQEYGPESSIVEQELSRFHKHLNSCIAWQLSPQATPGHGWLIAAIAEMVTLLPKKYFCRPGYMCIPPQHLCYFLQKHYNDKTISVPDITRQLRNEDLLSMDKSEVATKKVKGLGRCLCIDLQKLMPRQ